MIFFAKLWHVFFIFLGFFMNIYVGNLPFTAGEKELRDIFAEYGEVHSAKIIMDRETGRSKGFGFVEMSDSAARKAITELDEADLNGKTLTVNEARPRKEGFSNNRGGGGGGNRPSGGNRW
jgi:RNA recognition motif-containing protein